MNLFQTKSNRVKNIQTPVLHKDFSYSAVSFLVLGIFVAVGVFIQLQLFPDSEIESIVQLTAGLFFGGVLMALLPIWLFSIVIIAAIWINLLAFFSLDFWPLAALGSIGILVSASVELVYQWDKVVILRAGKFRKVHGPGLFILLPLLDRTAAYVDTRIRATDFSAEKTLTVDTVPVHVDALCFWMIWDAQKAVLEVENYLEAVTLSAQTALRDSIGKHDLASLLSEREELGREIQQALDSKTNPWGVSIMSVEITDIIIPKELENAMSKQAQAERERQSRVILSNAEVEIAEKFELAAEKYSNNPTAFQLRAMNMVYEGLRQNNSMMLMPSSALDNMNLGTVLGTQAMNDINKLKTETKEKQDD
ncbi:MAG: SPFH domain-containing protein [Spirochaetales bacterium]|uniref:SPFH domain-containing protein n=1 Tax=Candidatus Thalassospirochaeta sargassi TaxID=3119039 RepID=A0AAJ1IBY1_9SPIO|nr:SPFH domain-containing protein [Spirochaetales bacterium]